MDCVNRIDKNGCACPRDHNKLRTYKQFKGALTVDPYVELVYNRNQRSFLSRFCVSSHNLRVETGRWTFPKTRFEDRVCVYCDSGEVDTEQHSIIQCNLTECNCSSLYSILSSIDTSFHSLSNEEKLRYILCPVDALRAKLSNNFLRLLVMTRTLVDQGKPTSQVGTLGLGDNGITITNNT